MSLNYSATKILTTQPIRYHFSKKNKLPTAPHVSQQDTEQQTDASVDDRSLINQSIET